MSVSLLTPEETAQKLKVSPKTIRDWLRSGRIKGIKIGKLWRIRESDLERLLQEPLPLEVLDGDTQIWLEADLAGELPPYDWGSDGPPPYKPVHYIPGNGLMVEQD